MPTQQLVTLLDRWVTRGQPGRPATEELCPIHNTQRQHKQQDLIHNTQRQQRHDQNILRTKRDKELHQITLQGHNLDLHDGEEYGDKLTPKSMGTFRIIQQNIKLIPENPKSSKNKQISNFISNGDTDVNLLQQI